MRDACVDDVKVTIIKENSQEDKNTCLLYMEIFTS